MERMKMIFLEMAANGSHSAKTPSQPMCLPAARVWSGVLLEGAAGVTCIRWHVHCTYWMKPATLTDSGWLASKVQCACTKFHACTQRGGDALASHTRWHPWVDGQDAKLDREGERTGKEAGRSGSSNNDMHQIISLFKYPLLKNIPTCFSP